MKFTEINLIEGLQRGIEEVGFVECTPVQERTFVQTLKGGDVLVQSQTGTGKTAAFLISIFQLFSTDPERRRKALVIVPTRELAVQVEEEARVLGAHLSFVIGSIFGGVGYNKQERLLEDGVDILIGTPGRLLDLAGSGRLRFQDFDTLVIDEADRMFDMGFFPDVRRIIRDMPDRSVRLTMLFSATLSTRVRNIAWDYMTSPVEIEIKPERVTVDEITQELYHVTTRDKVSLLLGIFAKEQPRNALIFTNTKYYAVELSKRLSMNGYPTQFIMGDLPQSKRQALIDGMKSGEVKFLVATDVAARGLHIDDLDLVVNYDLPEDFEIYVHRIGRTARAGKSGKAISFACEQFVYGLPAIENFIGMKIPVVWATDDLFVADKSAGINFRREIREFDDRGPRRGSGGRYERDRRDGRRPAAKGRAPEASRETVESTSAGAGASEGARRDRTDGRGARARNEKSRRPARSGAPEGGSPPPRAPARGHGSAPKPAADAPLEERLRYYRDKYGEDFQLDEAGNPRSIARRGEAQPAPGGRSGARERTGDPARRSPSPARNGAKSPRNDGAKSSRNDGAKSPRNDGARSPRGDGAKSPRNDGAPVAGNRSQGQRDRAPTGARPKPAAGRPETRNGARSTPASNPAPAATKPEPKPTLLGRLKSLFKKK